MRNRNYKYYKNRLVKCVARTEPNTKNQFAYKKGSAVLAYYLGQTNIESRSMEIYFNSSEFRIKTDPAKIKEYVNDVKKRVIEKYKFFYTNKLLDFENDANEFLEKEVELNVELSERTSNRLFLKINPSSFGKLILGDITLINFDKNDNNEIIVSLSLVKNVAKSLNNSLRNTTLDPDALKSTFEYYETCYHDKNKAIAMFTLDYGFFIKDNKADVTSFIDENDAIYNSILALINDIYIDNSIDEESDSIEESEYVTLMPGRKKGAFSKVVMGVPGSGKSYYVSQLIRNSFPKGREDEFESLNVIRTTFHREYTHVNFVGQLMPYTDKDGNVKYEPNPGPFTVALKRAYNTTEMVYLVIEELNRGSFSAIFGDIFQLLDRYNENNVRAPYNVGDSEYPITNRFIEDYVGLRHGDVRIPSNLTIYATMNTSDQGVEILDTASSRRWLFENYVASESNQIYKDYYVPNYQGEEITWKEFVDSINETILSGSNPKEDKCLGPYFVGCDSLVSPAEYRKDSENIKSSKKVSSFNYKLFYYLWNSVIKVKTTDWISNEISENVKTLNQLIAVINKYGLKKVLLPLSE